MGMDYVQIMNTGRKHWVTAVFEKGKYYFLKKL